MALTVGDDLYVDVEVRVSWVKERDGRYAHGMVFTRILDEDRENVFAYISGSFPDLLRHNWWDS